MPTAHEPPVDTPIRVAFVSHLSDLSGAPRCLLLILQGLDRQRFTPLAVCPADGPLVDALHALDVPVQVIAKFPPPGWWGMRLRPLAFLAKLAYRLVYVARLYLVLRRARVQLVFLNTLLSSGATLAARLNGLPVVTQLLEYRLRFALTSPLRRRVVLRGARHLVAVSAAVAEVAIAHGADPARVSVAHIGIDTSRFPAPDPIAVLAHREEWGASPGDVVFGAAGALVINKGFQDLIAAAARVVPVLPNARFVIAGSVPTGEDTGFAHRLQAQIRSLGLDGVVRLLGQVTDMPRFFGALDVLVIPSHDEALPVVALEAMAMGKPILGTSAGGLPELVVPESTGLLVPPRSPDELAAGMVRLGADPLLRRRMGAAGSRRVSTCFTVAAYVAQVEQALSEAMRAA